MANGKSARKQLAARVKALEKRVAALEPPEAAAPDPVPPDAEQFWESFDTGALLEMDWAPAADALSALGHPVRLRLLREVLHGVHTVHELGAIEGMGTSGQLYHHLRQLVAAGWLRSAGRGRYEVPAPRAVPLLVVIAGAQR